MGRYAIILAAGKGTRMKSLRADISKVAFPILGRPMVRYVLEALKSLDLDKIVTIVGYGGEATKKVVENDSYIAWQTEQKGTGHAVMMAADVLAEEEGETIICCGDTPLLTDKTLSALLSSHETNHNDLTLMTAIFDDPHGYGRIVKKGGRVVKIVEQKDCTIEEDAIHEINAGVYVFNNKELFRDLKRLTPNNAAGEYYLTDVIGMFVADGKKVNSFSVSDPKETMGVNDRYALSKAEKIIRHRINKKWMLSGVSIEDPDSVYIGPDVEIAQDVTIRPNTMLLGRTSVKEDSILGPGSYLENAKIGKGATVTYSHICNSEIEDGAIVGPYARIRDGSKVGERALIGNFNELKNAKIGEETMCCHLSYVGDADIGRKANIGAGVIFANYDGVSKYHSFVEDGVFIGCGSTVISPVTIGEGAFVAAGTVVTEDVPARNLAIGRSRQENKPDFAPGKKK